MRGTRRPCWAHSASPRPQLGANQSSWPGCPLREPPAPKAYTPEPPAAPKPTAHPAPGRSRPYRGDTHLKDREEAPSAPPVWFPQTHRPGRGRGGAAGRRPAGAQSEAAAEGTRGPLTAPGLHVHSQLPRLDAAPSHRQTGEPRSGGHLSRGHSFLLRRGSRRSPAPASGTAPAPVSVLSFV